MGTPTFWLQGIPEDKQEEVASSIASSPVTKKLQQYLSERLDSIDTRESRDTYGSPSWAFLQAHRNGNREVLRELLQLLSFDPRN